MSAERRPWRIRIDTGGTFTDGVAFPPRGGLRRIKILSHSALRGRIEFAVDARRLKVIAAWSARPEALGNLRFRLLSVPVPNGEEPRLRTFDDTQGIVALDRDIAPPAAGAAFELRSDETAPRFAARLLTDTPAGAELPPLRLRLATTLGTNAVLERRGAATALFITRGFADLLLIGTQQRPELFRPDLRRPAPLYTRVYEIDGRLDARGYELEPQDLDALRELARAALDVGMRSAAVALLHSHRRPHIERRIADELRECGFTHVSCSAELAPRIKLLQRAQTAVVDAYVGPVVDEHMKRTARGLAPGALLVMTSAGGLLDAQRFAAKDSLLSGPAGGVVGAAAAARRLGLERVLTFDMGGTSTDVARVDGDFEYRYTHSVGDADLMAPALAIETVAAGGGSECWLDGSRLRVGPRSAGAEPGPACYGAGGPLTLTDVNLLLGRIDPARFEIPVDAAPARRRFDELLAALVAAGGARPDERVVLQGLVDIADETMADAIRRVSVRRGFDPADYALVAFGGAGGQHACGVARRLGVSSVLLPPDGALLSAMGLHEAVVERIVERQVLEPLDACMNDLAERFVPLEVEARTEVAAAGVAARHVTLRRRLLQVRFAGQEAALEIAWKPGLDVAAAFVERHRALFGHAPERRSVELESIRVVAAAASAPPAAALDEPVPRRASESGHGREFPFYERSALAPGDWLGGPALVAERHSTTWVEAGWTARVAADGALRLEREARIESDADGERPEAIHLELFTQRFTHLVREMGERMERTAVSTNVKERLDFSCALLDPAGELVVNAPHIPVHLGALGLCVRSVAGTLALGPGDVAVTNHPAFGGSHLPDVTTITPVFADDGGSVRLGWVASRAHHAEIGGSRPGSMPPRATRLVEEGVVLEPQFVVRGGEPCWDDLRRKLLDAAYPSRAVDDNLADLRAAVAANHAGAAALRALAAAHGAETVLRYMERVQSYACDRLRAAWARIGEGVHSAEERLDDGSVLRVRIELRAGLARFDFSGSADVHPGNLNATPAIVRSAVIYVLRLIVPEPLPLNEGLLRDVTIVLPSGLLNPHFPDDPALSPAVVGGNVETSQRLVDTLLKALGLYACSQGTMNNVIFGNKQYGYYETLGGGCGAGPDFDGPDATHSHMTNTRITDVEVLEHRYPVRVLRFALRRGSGGGGHRSGGDGLLREIEFLEAAELSVLTQHRIVAPYGLRGGRPGERGRQHVLRADGTTIELGPIDGCAVGPGDRFVIETPGGGGHGAPV